MSVLATLTPWDPKRGASVVAIALAEHARVVQEPPAGNPARIREYINAIGGPGDAYDSDGDWAWCGAFAAFCLIQAGARADLLAQKSPAEMGGLGSHYRMWYLARAGGRRFIERAADLRPGDVFVVGRRKPGMRPWGGKDAHIVIAASTAFRNGTVPTVEGNAWGQLGHGKDGEGVIRRSRPTVATADVRGFLFGLRLAPGDFTSEVI